MEEEAEIQKVKFKMRETLAENEDPAELENMFKALSFKEQQKIFDTEFANIEKLQTMNETSGK